VQVANGPRMDRRSFLKTTVAAAAVIPFGSSYWRAFASHEAPVAGPGPYGPLGAADPNGLRLPAGFSSRLIARSAEPVGDTSHVWHFFPDGGATFATDDGGWIYASNAEVDSRGGGVGAIRFASDGAIVDAYRILSSTTRNCAGGVTPWGTWLSCEETEGGLVWECDPTGQADAMPRLALGSFSHEAAAVDPVTSYCYLTEDQSDGRFYRFRPDPTLVPLPSEAARLLERGTLEVAKLADPAAASTGGTAVEWLPVPVPNPPSVLIVESVPTRRQVPESTAFNRGEGCWFDTVARTVFFSTTGDNRIWAHEVDDASIEVYFDGKATAGSPLRAPDNLTVAPSGDLLVCEDGDNLEMVLISADGEVAPFLRLEGEQHRSTELTGCAFDPSGTRLYFSSQRGYAIGATYEVTGPFRTERV